MRRLIAIALTLCLAACSTVGINTVNNGRALDPVHDDVASLLIAFDLPRGLGPNNATGQLFTFDVAQGGPQEHLRSNLIPADADQVAGNLPPPQDGRAYYLYSIDPQAQPAIRAAQAVAGPALIWFEIAEEQNVFPMMPAGKGLSDLIEKWGGADE